MENQVNSLIDHLNRIVKINQEINIEPEYSLIVVPEAELLDSVSNFITELSKTDDRHLYYDKPKIHGTIYGSIDIGTNLDELYSFLVKELTKLDLSFNVGGVATTAIILNPITFSLYELRKKMIEFLNDEKRLTRDHIMEEMTWLTTLRFKSEPNAKFLEFIEQNKEKQFGLFKPKAVSLYRTESKIYDNSWEKIFSINLQ